MGRANGVTTESRGGTVSRRTLLQSGAALATAGYVASAGIGTVSAQSDDPWPAQGFDPENTRHSPNTTPLRSYPAVVAQEDIPASAHADYTLTGGTAFLHSAGNGLGAIDTETGGLMWQVDMGGETIIPEGIDGSNVLARGLDGTVHVISMDSGSTVADVPLDQGYGLGYDGNNQWVAPVSAGRVVSGETGSPDVNWETSVEGVGVRPAVTDDRVVVSTVRTSPERFRLEDPTSMDAEGGLYVLDATDGAVMWETSRVGAGVGAPLVQNGVVYWTGTDGDILAYDIETGESVWEFKNDASLPRSPVAAGGMILAGGRDGNLYEIDARSGEEIDRLPVGAPISTNPVAADDVVYLGTDEGSIQAFEYDGGERLWAFETDAPVRSLTVSNGVVIAGTTAGYYVLSDEGSVETDGNGGTTGQTATGDDEPTAEPGDVESVASGDGAAPRQRGLFSNDGDEPDALSNPFNLTTLGFLLSVAGITYQMFQGR